MTEIMFQYKFSDWSRECPGQIFGNDMKRLVTIVRIVRRIYAFIFKKIMYCVTT